MEEHGPDRNGAPGSEPGWRVARARVSLPEVNSSVRYNKDHGFWRTLFAFSGPGLLVAVGYMDPGNWATDLEGGAKYGYTLLSVVLISNIFAMVLQHLSLKLGVVTDRDLAQACRDHFSWRVSVVLWVLCEIAIAACDLAEVIGSAIALNLLFGLPLVVGVLVTAGDVMIVLLLQAWGFRMLEAVVGMLILTIGVSFGYEIITSRPDATDVLWGLVPRAEVITDPGMFYIAIGILGATVMPHNLYLHSSVVQTRAYERDTAGRAAAIRFGTIDSTVALFLAFFINAAILVLSAATFHGTAHEDVADINDAFMLLSPVLGTSLASVAFGVALLAAGQNSTITGTLAGQIVMEGFLNIRLRPWLRRLVTRLIAIVPASIVAIMYGARGMGDLLILSQVILSMQLSFAVIPLVIFTGDRRKMGRFVNSRPMKIVAWTISGVIMVLNAYLLVVTVRGWLM